VQWGKKIAAPKSQQYENKGAEGAQSEPPPSLGEFPAHDQQAEIEQPHQHGPEDLWIAIGGTIAHLRQIVGSDSQSDRQQDKTGQEQPSDQHLESLNGREPRGN